MLALRRDGASRSVVASRAAPHATLPRKAARARVGTEAAAPARGRDAASRRGSVTREHQIGGGTQPCR